jgi:rhodanese-related sulfurtransferase
VAQILQEKGFRAHPLHGGFQAWQKANYPMDKKELQAT